MHLPSLTQQQQQQQQAEGLQAGGSLPAETPSNPLAGSATLVAAAAAAAPASPLDRRGAVEGLLDALASLLEVPPTANGPYDLEQVRAMIDMP